MNSNSNDSNNGGDMSEPSVPLVFPDEVRHYVLAFRRAVAEKNVAEVRNLYDQEFNQLSQTYFEGIAWPDGAVILDVVDQDTTFVALYKELFFRHIYAKLKPDFQDRLDSFHNYVDLFNILLGLDTQAPEVELPQQWLWDMIDEFVYQFQTFHYYRTNVEKLSPAEREDLKANIHMWSAQTVVQYLVALVRKAEIDVTKPPVDPSDEKSAVDNSKPKVAPMFQSLGEFALLGLLRVNSLMGDFTTAMNMLVPLNLRGNKRVAYLRNTAAQSTMYYYLGLCYMMDRRYVDALKTFSSFLMFSIRNKYVVPRGYQHYTVKKRIDKMYGLLAICTVFAPQRLDEKLHQNMRDQVGDRLQRMAAGEIKAFQDTFYHSAPKFVTLAVPNFDDPETTNSHQNMFRRIMSVVLREVTQRQKHAGIKSMLKLCTTIDTAKLATFVDLDEAQLKTELVALKHKSRCKRWRGGTPKDGEWSIAHDVDFMINSGNSVVVAEYKPPRRYGEFFIRHILRTQDTIADIRRGNEDDDQDDEE
eukprot:TRINITY_DN104003_c0_g1_i1.p2 TRINITY_DN104003_c0_g1~~TRINITY_DN104003_c0_g1_i1.p2  ORF type:complete len:536 (+),score=307.96 TRINITY_DN104003_c0_g1_i1:27-1610(+)